MTILTAPVISRLSVELLVRNLVLPRTVLRLEASEVRAPSGGTVTIRVPVPREAEIQSTPGDPIDFNEIEEDDAEIDVVHLYDAARLTDEDLTLAVESFGRQVLAPQVGAVATGAEDQLAEVINDLASDASFPADLQAASDAAIEDFILAGVEDLDDNDVPADNRFFAMGSAIAARVSRIQRFTSAADRGDGGSALSSAILGRIHGVTFVKSNGLDSDRAALYHRSAFGAVFAPPVRPAGAAYSAVASKDGISLRHIRQYNPSRLSDESVVSVFAGATLIDADRVYAFDQD